MDLEKFRVQGALGGYTFNVGSRSNFAFSLFMVSKYYYQIFFKLKYFNFNMFWDFDIFVWVHQVGTLFTLDYVQIWDGA